MLRRNISAPHRTTGVKPMNRFLEWLDRLAMIHPYAALQIFQL